jgi:hypothetical protein
LRYLLIIVVLWKVSLGLAQEKLPFENLSIDRPDISNLPTTVRPGHYQFEIGIEYSNNSQASAFNVPNFLLRTGLGKKTEVRLGASITRLDSSYLNFSHNISSASISIKHRIVEEKRWIPSIGIQPEASVVRAKVDESGNTTNGLTYNFLVLFNNVFHEQVFLNYNVGWFWFGKNEQRWLLSASLSFQHTHRVGYFIEAYTLRTWEERNNISFDGGITFLVHPRLQLDLYAGKLWALTNAIKYIGTGIGFRLDKGDLKHRSFKDIGIHH